MSEKESEIKPTPAAAKAMLKALMERNKAGAKIRRVDNASLYAGSPMYYYCRICGHEFELPENHLGAPSHCDGCKELLRWGYSAEIGMFPIVDVGLIVKPLDYEEPADPVTPAPRSNRRARTRLKETNRRHPSRVTR